MKQKPKKWKGPKPLHFMTDANSNWIWKDDIELRVNHAGQYGFRGRVFKGIDKALAYVCHYIEVQSRSVKRMVESEKRHRLGCHCKRGETCALCTEVK